MAFEGLADRLQNTIQKIRGKGKVNEADVKEMMREVRLALLEADVNFKVVKEFVKKSKRACCWSGSHAKLNTWTTGH